MVGNPGAENHDLQEARSNWETYPISTQDILTFGGRSPQPHLFAPGGVDGGAAITAGKASEDLSPRG
jgi:hypothetical protein